MADSDPTIAGLPTSESVLIVEDDPMVGEFLRRAFEHGGTASTVVTTADAATTSLRGNAYGAVFIDGLLPDMHGTELARRILEETSPDVPICLISGALSADIPERHGIAALTKPARPRVLIDALEQLTQWARSPGDTTPADRTAALEDLARAF